MSSTDGGGYGGGFNSAGHGDDGKHGDSHGPENHEGSNNTPGANEQSGQNTYEWEKFNDKDPGHWRGDSPQDSSSEKYGSSLADITRVDGLTEDWSKDFSSAAEPQSGGTQSGGAQDTEYEICKVAAEVAVSSFTSMEPGTYTAAAAMIGPEAVPVGMGADWFDQILRSSPAAEELLKTGIEGLCNDVIRKEKHREPSHDHFRFHPTLRRP